MDFIVTTPCEIFIHKFLPSGYGWLYAQLANRRSASELLIMMKYRTLKITM